MHFEKSKIVTLKIFFQQHLSGKNTACFSNIYLLITHVKQLNTHLFCRTALDAIGQIFPLLPEFMKIYLKI